jgi:hypothetical protein
MINLDSKQKRPCFSDVVIPKKIHFFSMMCYDCPRGRQEGDSLDHHDLTNGVMMRCETLVRRDLNCAHTNNKSDQD